MKNQQKKELGKDYHWRIFINVDKSDLEIELEKNLVNSKELIKRRSNILVAHYAECRFISNSREWF
jgi:hypothetical protein